MEKCTYGCLDLGDYNGTRFRTPVLILVVRCTARRSLLSHVSCTAPYLLWLLCYLVALPSARAVVFVPLLDIPVHALSQHWAGFGTTGDP